MICGGIKKLLSCNDVDLKILQSFEELPCCSALHMIGDVLLEFGQYRKAENFYYKMLDESNLDNETRFNLYYMIAVIAMKQGRYRPALENFVKIIHLCLNTNNILKLPKDVYVPDTFHFFYLTFR